ncbi:MAG: hypothetical protein Q7U13_01140 [Rhodoferax sp.]|nr:hypothetical protein [Rhodoferax sp.]
MNQADFALAKGLNLSAAKSRIQRARLRLKQRMTQVCQVQMDDAGTGRSVGNPAAEEVEKLARQP